MITAIKGLELSLPSVLSVKNKSRVDSSFRRQRTLRRSVSFVGKGLFTGETVTVTLRPVEAGEGIVFKRTDLPHQPLIAAQLDGVHNPLRCTQLSQGGATLQTVEHLLAALRAYDIDNLLIEVSGSEIPIFDGSAEPFVAFIEKGEIATLDALTRVYRLATPISWSQGDVHLIALPSEEYRISYTLHYPNSALLRSQYCSVLINSEHFKKEIAPCRTFAVYEEIAPFIEKGLIKGGSLDNGVVIKEDRVVNPEGTRFTDEMVRHKVLDLVGDLSLIRIPFLAHIIAIRSGHSTNCAFARELLNHIKREN